MGAKPNLIEWLQERRDNCMRIAQEKMGKERDGWLEDAAYFELAIRRLRLREQVLPPHRGPEQAWSEVIEPFEYSEIAHTHHFVLTETRGGFKCLYCKVSPNSPEAERDCLNRPVTYSEMRLIKAYRVSKRCAHTGKRPSEL